MILSNYIDPCQEIRYVIIKHLHGLCGGFSRPINQTQIRAILDVSGDPKDSCGIIIGCENMGQHGGGDQHGILIDVQPRIVVFSHLNDDADGSICNALVADTSNAMQTINYSDVMGWRVKWNGSWTMGDATMDGSYRQIEMSATLPLVRRN